MLLTGVLACTAGAQEFISAIDNPAFVQSVLSNLPGVDATDPKVLERLKKLRVRVCKPPSVRPDPSYDPARSGGRVEYAEYHIALEPVEYAELQRAHARACTRMHMHHAQARTCSHARSRNTLTHATRASIEADRAVKQSTVRHVFVSARCSLASTAE